jgi:hypothetical protein
VGIENLKRGLASLFQMQLSSGTTNEVLNAKKSALGEGERQALAVISATWGLRPSFKQRSAWVIE